MIIIKAPLKGIIGGYERGVAQLQEGVDCRALWLSVIQQAILDSQKARKLL